MLLLHRVFYPRKECLFFSFNFIYKGLSSKKGNIINNKTHFFFFITEIQGKYFYLQIHKIIFLFLNDPKNFKYKSYKNKKKENIFQIPNHLFS